MNLLLTVHQSDVVSEVPQIKTFCKAVVSYSRLCSLHFLPSLTLAFSISRHTKVTEASGFRCKMLRTVGLLQSSLQKCYCFLILYWKLLSKLLNLSQYSARKQPIMIAVPGMCSGAFFLSRVHMVQEKFTFPRCLGKKTVWPPMFPAGNGCFLTVTSLHGNLGHS